MFKKITKGEILEEIEDWTQHDKEIKCKCDCGFILDRKAKNIKESGIICRNCVKNKIKETNIKKFGTEYPFQSKDIQNKIKENVKDKYGVSHISQLQSVKDTKSENNLKKYGVKYSLQIDTVRQKIKKTNLIKFGFENPSKSDLVKEKRKKTCKLRYGVDYFLSSKKVRDKIKETNIKKYGVEYISQNKDIQRKIVLSNFLKYGVRNPLLCENIKKKVKDSIFNKYNVFNVMQNPIIAEKCLSKGYTAKNYILPSGCKIKIQGYENRALDELLKIYDEEEIIVDKRKVPEIWYNDSNGKKHRHYVDIFLPKFNKCIEVKSTYTFKQPNVFEKKSSAIELGYNYEIWVYNNKGDKKEIY